MSVLDPETPMPLSPAQRIANQLKQNARNTFRNLVTTFTQNSKLFWQNSEATPTEIAAALGPHGAELFQLHGKIGQLLADVKPESVQAGLSFVGQYTIGEDGVITITPPEGN